MAVFEIFRANFMAPIDRKACKNIQKRTFCQRMETRLESCGDRCVGSEWRVRLGEEIGRRQSARLVTLLVGLTPRSCTTKPKGAEGQYTAMMSLLFQVRQSTGPWRQCLTYGGHAAASLSFSLRWAEIKSDSVVQT